ncbi:MAG: PKD domain-containing protein [Verrucomicrobiia bacterium]|jgi:PKD repeat protein
MKRIIRSSIVLAVVALATGALAQGFTAGNLVVYRMGGGTLENAGVNPLSNTGSVVYLDEFTTNGVFVQSHMMPTNYFGGNSPLIDSGTAFGNGLITRSADGRFILVVGYGATTNQFSHALGSAYGTEAPRVVATVDGNGYINTETTLTNSLVNGSQLRSACSVDGTNLYFSGDGVGGEGVCYTPRGGSGVATNFPGMTNIRQLNIFSNHLYFSSASNGTNVFAVTNNVGGLTETMRTTNDLAVGDFGFGVTNSSSPWSFLMFKLHGGGADSLDTLYVTDSPTAPGTKLRVWKYSLSDGTWTGVGSITVNGAIGMTGQTRITGTTTNVDLWLTGGGGTLTGNDAIYAVTDSSGYNGNPGGVQGVIALGDQLPLSGISVRGIAFAPVGGETYTDHYRLSVGPLLDVHCTGSTGCTPTNTYTYSLANLGWGNSMGWTMSYPNWVDVNPHAGSIDSGGSLTVTVSFNDNAQSLSAGTNIDTITFNNTESGHNGTQTRQVQLVMYDQDVSPKTDFDPQGPIAGPFSPTNKVYTVYNGGAGTINVVVTNDQSVSWLGYSATNFSLAKCTSTKITISCDTNAANVMSAGNYPTSLMFSNATAETVIQAVTAQLTVGGVYFCDDFSAFTQNANLAGQQNWVANGSGNEPWVSNSAVYVSGTSSGGGDEPYKNISITTTKSGFLYAGMMLVITSAPPVTTSSPSRMTCFFQNQNAGGYAMDYLSVRDVATNSGEFVFCARNPFTWKFDTTHRKYGLPYQVIIMADPGVTNMYVWINPASSAVTTNAADIDANNASDTGSDWGLGSYSIQNQYGSGQQPGVSFNKICITTNLADTYNATAFLTPIPGFNASPVSGTAPLTVTFTDTSSPIPLALYWNLGDGTLVTNNDGAVFQHAYAVGTYTVSLKAVNPKGNVTLTQSNYITVTAPITAPSAGFSSTTPVGLAPWPVTFSSTSTGTKPLTLFWNLGDGNLVTNTDSGSGATVGPHPYAAGVYTVALIASNAASTISTNVQNRLVWAQTPLESWQQSYFGTTNGAALLSTNSASGLLNSDEFAAGFSPINAAAYPHVVKIVKSTGNMVVTYLGANGDNSWSPGIAMRTNVLEFTTGSPAGNYSNNFATAFTSDNQGTNILSGGSGIGTNVTVTDTGGATGATRYYRVRVIAP